MNVLGRIWSERNPPAPNFSSSDIPDLGRKVVLITGGNSGIGKETAKVLLTHGARVYIACRSKEKADAAVQELIQVTEKTDNDISILSLDLSDLASIKKGVDEFLKRESRLDVLLNSGGVMFPPISQLTTHGHDLQFGTNVLGHFYLTQLLLPTLMSSAKTSSDSHTRVVNLSSVGHIGAPSVEEGGPVIYDTLLKGKTRNKMGSQKLYYQSKAGNIMFSNALARKYGSQGVISIALHPGAIDTGLYGHSPTIEWMFRKTVLQPVELGALGSLYAATSPEALELNGKYLVPWARVGSAREDMAIVEKQEELWTWMEDEVRKHAAV